MAGVCLGVRPDQANLIHDLAVLGLTLDGDNKVVATPVGTPAEVESALEALDHARMGAVEPDETQDPGRSERERYSMIVGEDLGEADPLAEALNIVRRDRQELLRLGRELEIARDHIRRLYEDLAARPDTLRSMDLGMVAAALAPGEALSLPEVIARVEAYRRHSVEFSALEAMMRSSTPDEAPFPWDAGVEAVAGPRDLLGSVLAGLRCLYDALGMRRAAKGGGQ